MWFNSYTENTLEYKQELCINCGKCSEVCPHGVFSSGEKTAVIFAKENCMECGACMLNCPVNAISVESGAGCAYGLMMAAITGNPGCECGGNNANFSSGEKDTDNCKESCCGK